MLAWLKKAISAASAAEVAAADPRKPVATAGQQATEAIIYKSQGDACLDEGNWEAAIVHYHNAITALPQYAEAHGNLGFALAQQRQFDSAQHHLNLAVSVKPELFNSFYVLGTISHQLGRTDDAIEHFKKAISVKPDFAEAFNYLGIVYLEQGDRFKAFDAYRSALAVDPQMATALYNFAGLLETQGDHVEAIVFYRRALAVSPELESARLGLVHQLMQICDWTDLASEIDAVRRHIRESTFADDSRDSPFAFFSLPSTTAAEQKRCAQRWVYSMCQKPSRLRETLGFTFERQRNDKPHIGYLSADFREHATTRLMARVFQLHDRSRFTISAYSYGTEDSSKMSERLKASFDQFVDIRGLSDLAAADRIYHDKIDILIDLKGYTGESRSAILALRPAPIQVNYLGYPGTMGADFVDYLIADRFIVPEQSRADYTEKIVYLPDTYQPNDCTRARPENPGRASVGLPETGLVFCCFNQTFKITPEIFSIWCELLKRVPGSVLWLMACNPQAQENLQREAVSRGVDQQRLIFAPRVGAEDHLARHHCADLFLDTIPVNAHTTCSDALWMGLPVITIAGDTFPARVAGSLLSAIGVPELIADNTGAYFALAFELATDDVKRNEIRARIIANRESAPLFDSQLFTRNLEQVYQTMLDGEK